MPTTDLQKLTRDNDLPLEAFVFVQRGLDFTVRRLHDHPDADENPADSTRHVSGQNLCEGLRDFALQEYGLLARTVLKHMKIRNCKDFGRIVFLMVDAGMMHKTDDDSLDDFQNVYDFADAFGEGLQLTGNA